MELEETIMHINESLKSLQIELRQAEDEAAKLQRQRVSYFTLVMEQLCPCVCVGNTCGAHLFCLRSSI